MNAGYRKIHRFLNHHLGDAEEINGKNRYETYLYRWVLADPVKWKSPLKLHLRKIIGEDWKIYLHKFVGNDWSRDLHDHPKRFISIGIWGSYEEETPAGFHRYRAPWIRTFPANHKHRLTTPWGTCWTIVIVLKAVREWGFWHEGQFIDWHTYVHGDKGSVADQMKDCP